MSGSLFSETQCIVVNRMNNVFCVFCMFVYVDDTVVDLLALFLVPRVEKRFVHKLFL